MKIILLTIVTTVLIEAVAWDFGVPCHIVLTGWKYLAEQVELHREEGGEFVCGGEESCGFNAGEFVRDKDGQLACSLLAECAAWAADREETLYGLLQDLYKKYGYRQESRFSLVRKGAEGAAEIRRLLENFRKEPPKALAGIPVVMVKDYLKPEETGLPAADVLQFFSSSGDIVSVRPSGTEPKVRFYFSVTGPDAPEKTEMLKRQFTL